MKFVCAFDMILQFNAASSLESEDVDNVLMCSVNSYSYCES